MRRLLRCKTPRRDTRPRCCRRRSRRLSRDKHSRTHALIRVCTLPRARRWGEKKGKKKKPCRFQSITHRPGRLGLHFLLSSLWRWLRILFTSRRTNPSRAYAPCPTPSPPHSHTPSRPPTTRLYGLSRIVHNILCIYIYTYGLSLASAVDYIYFNIQGDSP